MRSIACVNFPYSLLMNRVINKFCGLFSLHRSHPSAVFGSCAGVLRLGFGRHCASAILGLARWHAFYPPRSARQFPRRFRRSRRSPLHFHLPRLHVSHRVDIFPALWAPFGLEILRPPLCVVRRLHGGRVKASGQKVFSDYAKPPPKPLACAERFSLFLW
jgi:hypothetical protein